MLTKTELDMCARMGNTPEAYIRTKMINSLRRKGIDPTESAAAFDIEIARTQVVRSTR